MILLNKEDYNKVTAPLNEVHINTLFASFIADKTIEGKIYVDNIAHPETFYIVHPYGMTLLFGKYDNPVFNAQFKNYILHAPAIEWMQAYPRGWDNVIKEMFTEYPDSVCYEKRINLEYPLTLSSTPIPLPIDKDITIRRTTKEDFHNFNGSVIPSLFWDNADQFINQGIGFSLLYKNELASIAFSAYTQKNKLEFGIETREKFRHKSFAYFVSAALLNHCINNRTLPLWACRLGNEASLKLALKLGFKIIRELPYYKLTPISR